jgi:hypothetical protein
MLVIVGVISWIFFWPLTFSNVISVADMPSIILFIVIMMFTLVRWGFPSRVRPRFQFHYHEVEFPVMDELKDEVGESV